MRTHTSFQKRQKEIARAEKQRDKAAKRLQKKLLAKQAAEAGKEPAQESGTPEQTLDPTAGTDSTR